MSFNSLIENNLYVERCTVFKWYDYTFHETGEIRDKYWITLNCKINDFPINVILPTSQYNNNYYTNPINLIDCIIINKGESQYFDAEKTILDLKNIIKEEKYTIEEAYQDKYLIRLGSLESDICSKIEDTIKNSDLLEQHIINKLLCK